MKREGEMKAVRTVGIKREGLYIRQTTPSDFNPETSCRVIRDLAIICREDYRIFARISVKLHYQVLQKKERTLHFLCIILVGTNLVNMDVLPAITCL